MSEKKKKPIYKRVWFIGLVVVILIGVIGSLGGNSSTDTTSVQEKQNITYTPHTVSELVTDLEGNALKANEKYKDQYVQLTGRLETIDSDGKYISIGPTDIEFSFTNVQCYIKSDEQKAVVANLAAHDTVVVKGKITDVGELLGYSLDIDEIVKQ